MNRSVGIALPLVLLSLSLAVTLGATDSRDPNFFCAQAREFFPEWDWQLLRKGDRVETNHALVTCRGSSVTVKSNLAFDPAIDWKEEHGVYRGLIAAEVALVVRTPETRIAQPKIELEVLEVTGEAIYSTKRHLIGKNRGALQSSLIRSQKDFLEKQRQRWDDLKAIGWKRLTPDRVLQPWDMIWTKDNGRIEIEILEKGKEYFADDSTDVRTKEVEYTLRKRFPRETYFIMHPEIFRKARVNKIISEVLIATDKTKVQKFFEKYQSPYKTKAPQDPTARKQWLESLRTGEELK